MKPPRRRRLEEEDFAGGEVLSFHGLNRHKQATYLVRCGSCGETRIASQQNMCRRKNVECQACTSRRQTTTHGMYDHLLYSTWNSMRARCNTPTAHNYAYYGGRGIRVCSRWDDFTTFVSDMGPRPPKHTLDRIDPDGDYTPENCRWADKKTQMNNQRRHKRGTLLHLLGELTTESR